MGQPHTGVPGSPPFSSVSPEEPDCFQDSAPHAPVMLTPGTHGSNPTPQPCAVRPGFRCCGERRQRRRENLASCTICSISSSHLYSYLYLAAAFKGCCRADRGKGNPREVSVQVLMGTGCGTGLCPTVKLTPAPPERSRNESAQLICSEPKHNPIQPHFLSTGVS